jgi:hypothetical protein
MVRQAHHERFCCTKRLGHVILSEAKDLAARPKDASLSLSMTAVGQHVDEPLAPAARLTVGRQHLE